MGRRIQGFVAVLAAVFMVSGVATASTGALDQSFITPSNLADVISNVCPWAGQTFTAGRTGQLTGVELEVNGFAPNLLSVQAWSVTHGVPGREHGSVTLASSSALSGQFITFPQRLHVTKDHQYALVAHYEGELTGENGGLWGGAVENKYRGGTMITKCVGQGWRANHDGYDVHFQTYVSGK